MRRLIEGVALFVAWGVSIAPTASVYGPLRVSDSCSVTVVDQRRALLETGEAVTVDASNATISGKALLVLGTPTMVWGAGPTTQARPSSSPFGILRDTAGTITLVPSSVPGAVGPRAAPVPGGWQVLFVVPDTGERHSAATPSAVLWHAFFDGHRWSDVHRIGVVHHALLSPAASPDVVGDGDTLTYAYSFDRPFTTSANERGDHGVILVRGAGARFRSTRCTRGRPRTTYACRLDSERVKSSSPSRSHTSKTTVRGLYRYLRRFGMDDGTRQRCGSVWETFRVPFRCISCRYMCGPTAPCSSGKTSPSTSLIAQRYDGPWPHRMTRSRWLSG